MLGHRAESEQAAGQPHCAPPALPLLTWPSTAAAGDAGGPLVAECPFSSPTLA